MILSDKWTDYELIDCGSGEKYERWGKALIQRPDPQAIWPKKLWPKADAVYIRSNKGGGRWTFRGKLPDNWTVAYPGACGELRFGVNLTAFKHTGLFPEQATNWDFMAEQIMAAKAAGREVRVLNLFAYTGGATVACSKAGADEVVHVDASKGMNGRAKENLQLSGCGGNFVRFICDDVNKFVEREKRRGRQYDAIVMDPPAYGRGPSGELWQLEDQLYDLVSRCASLVSDRPLFFLINSYASMLSAASIAAVAELVLKPRFGGQVMADEIGLPMTMRSIPLPCGCTARWVADAQVGVDAKEGGSDAEAGSGDRS